MNRYFVRWMGVIAALAGVTLVASWNGRVMGENAAKPVIRVADFRQSTIIGRLGIPLGRVAVMEGEVILEPDDKSAVIKPRKGPDRIRCLAVQSLDGEPMERSVAFGYDLVGWPKNRVPQAGTKVRYAVYEAGAFEGLPEGDRYGRSKGGFGFMFVSKLFVVHDFDEIAPRQQVPNPRD